MKITDCGFNNSNILFAVIDGVLILANKDTAEMYKVNVVSKFKPTKIKGVKYRASTLVQLKNIKIKRRNINISH